MSFLGLTASEYSSGDQRHRGHITKTGNRHARRLLIEAAWHYRHRPRRQRTAARPQVPPESPPAPGRPRSACTTATATSPTTASAPPSPTVAVARELAGFLWAAMTDQPLRPEARRRLNPPPRWGRAAGATARRTLDSFYAIPTRDPSARQLTTGHCPAVPTRASQSDSRRCRRAGRPAPAPTTMTDNTPTSSNRP